MMTFVFIKLTMVDPEMLCLVSHNIDIYLGCPWAEIRLSPSWEKMS